MAGRHHGGSGRELWEMVRVREAWRAAVHGVSESDWTGQLSSCLSSCFTVCVGLCRGTWWLGRVYVRPLLLDLLPASLGPNRSCLKSFPITPPQAAADLISVTMN